MGAPGEHGDKNVITTAELHRVAENEGLRFDQVEKDYVILWLLSGLADSGAKDHARIFRPFDIRDHGLFQKRNCG